MVVIKTMDYHMTSHSADGISQAIPDLFTPGIATLGDQL